MDRLSDLEIVGAYDTEACALKAFAQQHSTPTFTDVDNMVEETNPTILDVLTPSGVHAKSIFELMGFNKHFVAEKPPAYKVRALVTKEGLRRPQMSI